jgi:hypothetical protein
MLVLAVVLVVLLFAYLLGSISDKVDHRANELQLSLDGIKDRLYYLEKRI